MKRLIFSLLNIDDKIQILTLLVTIDEVSNEHPTKLIKRADFIWLKTQILVASSFPWD